MAALYDQAVYDAALNVIKTATALHICSGTPATGTDVTGGTLSLANVTVSSSDYTLGAGSPSGRQITVAAKSGVSVTRSGTPAHYCLLAGSVLIARVGVNPASPNLTSGSVVDIPITVWTLTAPTES